jgi:acetyl esterase/lipase
VYAVFSEPDALVEAAAIVQADSMTAGLATALWVLTTLAVLHRASSLPSSVADLTQQVLVGPVAGPNATSLSIVLNSDNYSRRTHQFPCQSVKCTGWLYTPKTAAAGSSRPPVIVMGHGLGGDKSHLHQYAVQFANSGFAVFSFDYRFWGDSEGEPRHWIAPPKQVEDWLSAVKFVQTDLSSSVDATRLSLWGTSFGGGHVVTIASKLGGQIKAVVSQVSYAGRLERILACVLYAQCTQTHASKPAVTARKILPVRMLTHPGNPPQVACCMRLASTDAPQGHRLQGLQQCCC